MYMYMQILVYVSVVCRGRKFYGNYGRTWSFVRRSQCNNNVIKLWNRKVSTAFKLACAPRCIIVQNSSFKLTFCIIQRIISLSKLFPGSAHQNKVVHVESLQCFPCLPCPADVSSFLSQSVWRCFYQSSHHSAICQCGYNTHCGAAQHTTGVFSLAPAIFPRHPLSTMWKCSYTDTQLFAQSIKGIKAC